MASSFTLFDEKHVAVAQTWEQLLAACDLDIKPAQTQEPTLHQCTLLVLMGRNSLEDIATMFRRLMNEVQLTLFTMAFEYHVASKRGEFEAHQAAELKEADLCKALSVADPQDQEGIAAVHAITAELACVLSHKRSRSDQ